MVRFLAMNVGEDQVGEGPHSGGFWKGLGLALASAFIGTFLLLWITLAVAPTHHSFFWTVVVIAGAFPTLGVYFTRRWVKVNKSMASGARVAVIIGIILAVGIVAWFISVLNSLGS